MESIETFVILYFVVLVKYYSFNLAFEEVIPKAKFFLTTF